MSPVFTLLHWIHSSSNDSPQMMHSVSWSWERGSGVGFSLFDKLLTFFVVFGSFLESLVFSFNSFLNGDDVKISLFRVLLFLTDNRFFEASGRGDKILSTSLTSSVLTEDLGISLWSLLEAKAEALVDGSGSFSVAAAWLQTWVVDCSAWFSISGISVKAEPKSLGLNKFNGGRVEFWCSGSRFGLFRV